MKLDKERVVAVSAIGLVISLALFAFISAFTKVNILILLPLFLAATIGADAVLSDIDKKTSGKGNGKE